MRPALPELPLPSPVEREILVPVELVEEGVAAGDNPVSTSIIGRENLNSALCGVETDASIALEQLEILVLGAVDEASSQLVDPLGLIARRRRDRDISVGLELDDVEREARNQRGFAVSLGNDEPADLVAPKYVLYEGFLPWFWPPRLV